MNIKKDEKLLYKAEICHLDVLKLEQPLFHYLFTKIVFVTLLAQSKWWFLFKIVVYTNLNINEEDHKNDQPTSIYKKEVVYNFAIHLIIIIMGNTWDCKYLIYSNISQHFSIQLKKTFERLQQWLICYTATESYNTITVFRNRNEIIYPLGSFTILEK